VARLETKGSMVPVRRRLAVRYLNLDMIDLIYSHKG